MFHSQFGFLDPHSFILVAAEQKNSFSHFQISRQNICLRYFPPEGVCMLFPPPPRIHWPFFWGSATEQQTSGIDNEGKS